MEQNTAANEYDLISKVQVLNLEKTEYKLTNERHNMYKMMNTQYNIVYTVALLQ